MKKLTLILLFALSTWMSSVVNADTATKVSPPIAPQVNTVPVWPSSVPVYRWPSQQMMNQPRAVPTAPMYSNVQQLPRAVQRYPAPYNVMQYPRANTGYPPVLRYPANQTFQQARPVYNFNMPYGTPIQAAPYAGQYPSVNRQNMLPQSPMMSQQPANKQAFPAKKKPKAKEKKPWGDTRHIWPDFYTNSTGDLWDDMMNAPYDMGRMPGGWRAPSLSTPDPVTVGDAVTNQFPPVIDEVPNFMPFMN